MQDGTRSPLTTDMGKALSDLEAALKQRFQRSSLTPEEAFPAAGVDVSRALVPSASTSPAKLFSPEMNYVQALAGTLRGIRGEEEIPIKSGVLPVVFQLNYAVMRLPQIPEWDDVIALCKELFAEKISRDLILRRGPTPHTHWHFSDEMLENPLMVARMILETGDPDDIYLAAFFMNSKRDRASEGLPGKMVQAYDYILGAVGEDSGLNALSLLHFTGFARLRLLNHDHQIERMTPYMARALREDPVQTFQILAAYALKAELRDPQQEKKLANHLELTFRYIHPESVCNLANAIIDVRKDGPLAKMAAWYAETGLRQRPTQLPRVLAAMAERLRLGS